MKKMECEICEGSNFLKQEGVFICQSCGTRYSVEEAKKMLLDNVNDVENLNNNYRSDKTEKLLKIARRAKEDGNIEQAFKYYEQAEMEDPNNWECAFYVAYFSALIKLKNDNAGDSVSVRGNTVSLGGRYRDGLAPSIKLISNCLDSVFSLIELNQNYEEQVAAMVMIEREVNYFVDALLSIIETEYRRMAREILEYSTQIEGGAFQVMDMKSRNKKTRDEYNSSAYNLLSHIKNKKNDLEEKIKKRRHDEYWDLHKSEKAELESEKQSISDKITTYKNSYWDISEYSDWVNIYANVQKLVEEKAKLGMFKNKIKNEMQANIDNMNNYIYQIYERIGPSVREIDDKIAPLEKRMQEIDAELTKPR